MTQMPDGYWVTREDSPAHCPECGGAADYQSGLWVCREVSCEDYLATVAEDPS